MHKLNIKPLSVNKAWKGRRFKTNDYKRFEHDLLLILPAIDVSKSKLKLSLELGFSNKLSDLSNPLKLVEDILAKKYGFNDRMIYQISMEKEIVKKGQEYIKFNLSEIPNS